MNAPRFSPEDLADALGVFRPTAEQAAVVAAPPGPLVVVAGAGAGKTETMAARVVWLIANGYATPGQVLGLTFTRKAAGQLLRRVRTRLARLAGTGLLVPAAGGARGTDGPALDGSADAGPSGADRSLPETHPTVGTYHAFAGNLLREYGLLLPIEPSARLLGQTELWQLALSVVCDHPGALPIDKTPAAVAAMVLQLAGQLAEHLVDTDQLRDTHGELERLVHHLPPGPGQRGTGPAQSLLKILTTQQERAMLVPLIDALHARMRAENVVDFAGQMSAAARLAVGFPQVGAELRRRYRVVLLDEYQDTGHAQRVVLTSLFGGGVDDGLALTAVGDPIQSIYGWRGASATNLPRFTTDFAHADGTPAPTLELRTSWRNPPQALHLANAVSAEARRRSVAVRELLPRPGAPDGNIRCALLDDVAAERDWVADEVARLHRAAVDDGRPAPTTAVLVRRNADAAPMAEALRGRGLATEVVGLAGLLGVAEVADVVAMLRLAADPGAGAAAVRVLTGDRQKLGAADLAALWRRARELQSALGAGPRGPLGEALDAARGDADGACLADAIADPGPADRYSAAGFDRIVVLGHELAILRAQLHHPLPDLVAEVRRVIGVDVEVRARQTVPAGDGAGLGSSTGTEHLDAFADVVADFAGRPAAARSAGAAPAVGALLAYLDAALDAEDGLPAAPVPVHRDRIQVMTVHSAKGLEWQVVAVPHLSARVFPSTASTRTWLSNPSDLPPLLRGDRITESEHGVPVLDTSAVADRKALADVITGHKAELGRRNADEERRLLYVAVTRAEDVLLVSGHHWGATEPIPRGPSTFLLEIKDVIEAAAAAGTPCGVVAHWAPEPTGGQTNPLRERVVEASWPPAPDADRAELLRRGADMVTHAMAVARASDTEGRPADTGDLPADAEDLPDVEGWAADVDALLAERAVATHREPPELPGQLSVSALVDLGRDPEGAVRRLDRRLPRRPEPRALLGTAFHEWVQRFFGAERLFDLDDLPGAVDEGFGRADAAALSELQAAFTASSWAARVPVDVEVPFDMMIGGGRAVASTAPGSSAGPVATVVRGRIDAVFADDDGGFTVVDWKTGDPPPAADGPGAAAVQLGAYRLAWAALRGVDPSSVRGALHYVRSGRTVVADVLPDADELAALLSAGQRGVER